VAQARKGSSHRRAGPAAPPWASWTDEQLLDLRLCDLGVTLHATWIEPRVHQLYDELRRRGIRFEPHVWLSNEWFSPDGVPGIAVPFYLAHPRLMQLERRQMFRVEGGTKPWCMRILRHEAGHAFDTAFRLRRTHAWRRLFGSASQTYPQTYRPRAESRDFVLHLEWWYAQSHPCEDFAESFAVWLTPRSRWRSDYAGWSVLRKLEYVDGVARRLGAQQAPVRTRARPESLRSMHHTLRSHYRDRRQRYGIDLPDFYDRQLERVFAPGRAGTRESASAFLRRIGPGLHRRVARLTGTHPYTVAQFLGEMIARSQKLRLRRSRSERHARDDVAILLAAQVRGYVHSGGVHVPM